MLDALLSRHLDQLGGVAFGQSVDVCELVPHEAALAGSGQSSRSWHLQLSKFANLLSSWIVGLATPVSQRETVTTFRPRSWAKASCVRPRNALHLDRPGTWGSVFLFIESRLGKLA